MDWIRFYFWKVSQSRKLIFGKIDMEKCKKVNSLLTKCSALIYCDQTQDESWKNRIATDLNTMLARVEYSLGMSPDKHEIAFANATFNIVERVACFEGISPAQDKLAKR